MIGTVLGRLFGSDRRGGMEARAMRPDALRYEKGAAEQLYNLCAEAAMAARMHPPASTAAQVDPRLDMHRRLRALVSEHGAQNVSDLPEADLRSVAVLAQSVLLRDEDFEAFVAKLPKGADGKARAERAAWVAGLEALAAAEEEAPVEEGEDAELREVWLAERELDLPDGLLAWIMSQDRATWHAYAAAEDWTTVDAERLEAVAWITTQPGCDRATALAFLASGVRAGLNDPAILPDLADAGAALLDLIHTRLIERAYPNADFALPRAREIEAARLLDAVPTEDLRGRFALARVVVEPLGERTPPARYDFENGQPHLSYKAWLAGDEA